MQYLLFVALLLFGGSQSAVGAILNINLMAVNSGSYGGVAGPCYCDGTGFVSQIYAVKPGDVVNFGTVGIYSTIAGGHETAPMANKESTRFFSSAFR